MTDTGQVPGEGQPESAGMVEQPGVPAHGAYTYLSEATAEDEELLLPGAQGAWGNEVPPPAPEPVLEAVHEPGPHETAGRDTGSVDLGGVRIPNPASAPVPPSPVLAAPHDPAAAQQAARRPLHLGPPIPDASASPVRSLADRGPAGAPVRQPGPPPAGPEYLDAQPLRDMAPQNAAPWGAAPAPAAETAAPAAAPSEEPVADPSGAAQAAVARLANQAAAPVQIDGGQAPAVQDQVVHAHDGMQPAHGHDGVYAAQVPAEAVAEAPVAPVAETLPVAEAVPPAAEVPVVAEPAQVAEAVAGQPVTGQPVLAPEAPVAVAEPVEEAAAVQEVQQAQVVQQAEQAQEVQEGQGVQETAGQAIALGAVPEAAQAADVAQSAETGPVAEVPQVSEPAQQPEPVQPSEAVQVSEGALPVEGAQPVEAVQPAEGTQVAEAAPAAPVAQAPVGAGEAIAVQPVAAADAGVVQDVAEAAVPAAPAQPDAQTPVAAEPVQAPEEQPAQAPVAPAQAQEAVPAPAEVPDPALLQAQGPQLAEAGAAAGAGAQAMAPADAPQEPQPQPQAPAPEVVAVPAGPQLQPLAATPAEATPVPPATEPVPTPAPAAVAEAAVPAAHPEAPEQSAPAPAETPEPLPSGIPAQPHPEQPLGQFVPVTGQVPTAPHLAPTPPQPIVLPTAEPQEPVAAVPAPREAGATDGPAPEVVQHAEDLETRAADQEESTAAVEDVRQSTGPAAPAYADAEREAVLKVMRERRDIRNGFRSDPIPHDVLLRVLEAAHTAPSVGHSQPWDFVVIRSAETRRTMHELAMRQREAYAKSLPKGRAKQFKELKIEAILDTPVNIVVTADPTRGGRHTLGRHTQPQMAPYSSALAVENLWLAARAEGLGVGWVSFFDEREMVRTLGLPEHLEVVAYLCVGYVDEFPDEPELMQAGWSKRRPLSWVVHEETYGRRALPGEEPHDLLAETVAQIRPLDAKALGEAWERQKRMTKPAGALGMLEIISAQLSGLSRQCPPPIPEPAAVAIFAGDHGVHAQGVTPWPQEVTAQMVANFLGGGAVCNAFANQVGAEVCVVDVGVAADLPATPGLLPRKIRGGTSDMTTGPAMTREEAKAAIEVGIETARDLVAAGNKALLTGEMGIANTTASAALISVFTGADPAEVTGRGTGINDETLARKTEVVRRALELHQPDPADPLGVLAAIGGFEHAAIVGLLLGGASLRTPVILDGVSAGAAALVARAIAPEVLAACIAGHRSAEPGHVAALNKLGLRPLVDLDLRLGEGTGALLALPLVQSTARAMHEVATFDSAGVTEK
ncbi:nicotinate-nucleotide--dimethylbenzimidazole phosphoribosyltransferase [Streptomyces sp. NPDC002671]